MKLFSIPVLLVLVFFSQTGCTGKKNAKTEAQDSVDTTAVNDTGYTGIKQYMSRNILIKEVTFKNGVRQGVMKSFYQTGEVRQTFWYENNLREDSSIWFYLEGQPFRMTPYKRDTIDGIQKQFYRTGQLKARIGFSKGLRNTFFEEYTKEGKVVRGYPEVVIKTSDDYKTKSAYKITMELSDKSPSVKFYRGELSNGLFDTARYKPIPTLRGVGTLNLRKSTSAKSSSIEIIASIVTNFGNYYLVYKKIDLPYPDLK